LGEVATDQVARCWVLMSNVSEADVETAKASSISIAAAQNLKAPEADGGLGGARGAGGVNSDSAGS
jgi:hypothetical protein